MIRSCFTSTPSSSSSSSSSSSLPSSSSSLPSGRRILHLLFFALFIIQNERIVKHVECLESYYANVTLKAKTVNYSDDSDSDSNSDSDNLLSAVIYLPKDSKPDERTYYASSRFDWGSMIGSITRTTTNPNTGKKETHSLYGTKQWRLPHDPYWAESGVGLASEFGVGTDGSLCNFLCGWNQDNEVTNGVLGYQEAKNGESFLKIGVGELIKGSCSTCDSAEDYKFNSPYQFAKPPVWTMEDNRNNNDRNNNNSDEQNTIILSHEAVLSDRQHGYKLEKHITLNDDQLLVKTVLKNLGTKSFSTAWYSHHFFSCDSLPVHDGYSVALDLGSSSESESAGLPSSSSSSDGEDVLYNEPWTWTWSTPLEDYATVYDQQHGDSEDNDSDNDNNNNYDDKSVRIDMQRGVESNVRIKAEFTKDHQTRGGFTLRACNTKIRETIPEVEDGSSNISMYAYNLYIESGTFSPEPQILLTLGPGETKSWTQQLDFEDNYPPPPPPPPKLEPAMPLNSLLLQQSSSSSSNSNSSSNNRYYHPITAVTVAAIAVAIGSVAYRSVITTTRTRGRKQNYVPVPDIIHDHSDGDGDGDAI